MPPTPFPPTANQYFPGGGTNLAASSNIAASGAGYQKWFTHYQVMWGSWERVWEYKQGLTISNGALSGPPLVDNSYLRVSVNVKVIEAIEHLNWDNSFQQLQEVEFYSDSALSGGGTSGGFYTTVAGYTRDLFVAGNTEDQCNDAFSVSMLESKGPYVPSQDTYARFIGAFGSSVVLNSPRLCTRFKPDLLNL